MREKTVSKEPVLKKNSSEFIDMDSILKNKIEKKLDCEYKNKPFRMYVFFKFFWKLQIFLQEFRKDFRRKK